MEEETGSEWDELRKDARRLEGDLDVRLSSYAKLGADGREMQWKSMEMEIESLLEKLLGVNDSMSRCAAAAVPTISVTQKLTRHRDILHEFTQVNIDAMFPDLANKSVSHAKTDLEANRLDLYMGREFKRTRGNIMSLREHAELLTSVRNDINEYKIDEVTDQAEAIKGGLTTGHRNAFTDIQAKMKQLSNRFPVIRGLLGASQISAFSILFSEDVKSSHQEEAIKGHTGSISSYCWMYIIPHHLLDFEVIDPNMILQIKHLVGAVVPE
ncbi:hypothetical protein ACLOJK_004900 [Asimina triloba]